MVSSQPTDLSLAVVVPYHQNGTLGGYLCSQHHLGIDPRPDQMLDFLIQVTNGMKYLHDLGIVHGRLNICFDLLSLFIGPLFKLML
jgi:serine/threonine protein kinase